MIQPDHLFKQTLHNHETPLGERVSFQGVMKKRQRKRRAFFWFSLSSVLLLLVSLSAAAMLDSSAESSGPEQIRSTVGYSKPKTAADKLQSGQELSNPETTPINNSISSDANPTLTGGLNTKGTEYESINPKYAFVSTTVNNVGASEEFLTSSIIDEFPGTADPTEAATLAQIVIENNVSEWIKMLIGRGIADEYVFQIEPTQGSVLPEFVPYNPPLKSKFNPIFELNVTTAGNGYKYFRESKDITVAGNHRFSQYQAMMLFDMGRGVNIGTGVGYLESVGIGKALVSEWIKDSTSALVRVTKAENLSYRLNKLSIPLGIRYQLGFGRSIIRISATAMPGMVTLSGGNMFSRFAIQSMDNLKKNTFSFDARFGAGLHYQVSPKAAISAEPMFQYQSIPGAQWKSFRRLGYGFGLGVVFKP
jgi:hypothetical protein